MLGADQRDTDPRRACSYSREPATLNSDRAEGRHGADAAKVVPESVPRTRAANAEVNQRRFLANKL